MYPNQPQQQFYNQAPQAPQGWGQPQQQGWGQPQAQAQANGWGQPAQAAALPYNPTQPQHQAVQITVNNCPVNLSVLQNQVHPNFLHYLVPIAVACIDALQSRAAQNPLRMFLFNQMAENSYNNQNFLSLVKTVCDLAECNAATGGVQIEQAITGAVDLVIQFYAFNNMLSFPGLQQYLDPNTISNLRGLQQKQDQVTQVVRNYQHQKSMRVPQQGMGGYQQPQGFQTNTFGQQPLQAAGTPQSWHNQSTGMFSSALQSNQPEQPRSNVVDGWAATTHATQDWRTQFQQEPQAQYQAPVPQVQQSAQRPEACPPFSFNTPSAPAAPQQQQVSGINLSQYEKVYEYDGKYMVKYGEPGVAFKMSNRWPITPKSTRVADVYYILHENGDMEPIIKKLSYEEKVEREKHYAAMSAKDPKRYPPPNGTPEEIIAAREKLLKELQQPGAVRCDADFKKKAISEEEVVKDDTYTAVTAAEEAWSQADISMTLTDNESKPCTAYAKPALHVTPIVAKCDVKELVDDLKESVSLEQCAGKLKVDTYTIKSLVDKKQKRQRLTIHKKVDRILTESVNHYLAYKLGLPNVKIDSFEDDGGDILDYIKDNYPENYAKALEAAQTNIIKNVLSTTVDDFEGSEFDESVREQHLPEGDIQNNQPVFLYRKEVYLSVNMFAEELNEQELDAEDVSSVFGDNSPVLYSLCEHAVSCLDKLNEAEEDVYSYYLKTLDDQVYVFSRSALAPSTFLIGRKK